MYCFVDAISSAYLGLRFPGKDEQNAIAHLANVDECYIKGHDSGVEGDRSWVQSRYVACARFSSVIQRADVNSYQPMEGLAMTAHTRTVAILIKRDRGVRT